MSGNTAKSARTGREFVITRELNAPRETVFRAWTEREQLMQWFGPKGFKMPVCTNDLRPGGVMHYCLEAPDGSKIWGRWVYKAIEPPSRIEFVSSFSDENGGITRHPWSPEWPHQLHTVTTFEEKNGKTSVTVHWTALDATEAEQKLFDSSFDSMNQGWGGTFEQLQSFLAVS